MVVEAKTFPRATPVVTSRGAPQYWEFSPHYSRRQETMVAILYNHNDPNEFAPTTHGLCKRTSLSPASNE